MNTFNDAIFRLEKDKPEFLEVELEISFDFLKSGRVVYGCIYISEDEVTLKSFDFTGMEGLYRAIEFTRMAMKNWKLT